MLFNRGGGLNIKGGMSWTSFTDFCSWVSFAPKGTVLLRPRGFNRSKPATSSLLSLREQAVLSLSADCWWWQPGNPKKQRYFSWSPSVSTCVSQRQFSSQTARSRSTSPPQTTSARVHQRKRCCGFVHDINASPGALLLFYYGILLWMKILGIDLAFIHHEWYGSDKLYLRRKHNSMFVQVQSLYTRKCETSLDRQLEGM